MGTRLPDILTHTSGPNASRSGSSDAHFFPDYSRTEEVRSRMDKLEGLLDTLPTPSVEGIRARICWLGFVAQCDFIRRDGSDANLASALLADFEAFVATATFGQRSTSQRRDDVRALLLRHPEFSDREIARRVSCSPQTVGNIRRKSSSRPGGD